MVYPQSDRPSAIRPMCVVCWCNWVQPSLAQRSIKGTSSHETQRNLLLVLTTNFRRRPADEGRCQQVTTMLYLLTAVDQDTQAVLDLFHEPQSENTTKKRADVFRILVLYLADNIQFTPIPLCRYRNAHDLPISNSLFAPHYLVKWLPTELGCALYRAR